MKHSAMRAVTLGLFTGFSILSAVEILYYLGRLVTKVGAKAPGKAAKQPVVE